MGEGPDVGKPMGNVLGEDFDIFVVRAEIFLSLEICFVNLDDGLVADEAVIVCLHFFSLITLRVIEDHMLFGKDSSLILVYFVVVVPTHEAPAIIGHTVRHAASHQ